MENRKKILNCKNMKVAYDEVSVIENFQLDIYKGEIVSIIGPNGSGKSTALRALSNLYKNNLNTVFLDGEDIVKLKQKEIAKKLAILMQTPKSLGDMTVKELISFGRIAHNKWFSKLSSNDEEIIDWVMKKVNIKRFEDRELSKLSGGERQRVFIATSLVQQPKVLLLDEPTTYLDISYQLDIMELIKNLNEELNISIVMVLHDINQAITYSDRIVVMKTGKKIAEGKSEEILTENLLEEVYKVKAIRSMDKYSEKPYFKFFPLKK